MHSAIVNLHMIMHYFLERLCALVFKRFWPNSVVRHAHCPEKKGMYQVCDTIKKKLFALTLSENLLGCAQCSVTRNNRVVKKKVQAR